MNVGQLDSESFCPLCSGGISHTFVIDGYNIADCNVCGHRFVREMPPKDHVLKVYNDNYFLGGGAGYANYLAEANFLTKQGRRYGSLLASHAKPGRLLDIGCAAGFIARGLTDAGWQVTGLEPNERMARFATEKLGLDVLQRDLESVKELGQFDAISMIQVIGHFHDLRRSLEVVSELTEPGAFCLIEFWRRESIIARLFGKHWHEYSPPSVLHWFTSESLDFAMQQRGFENLASGAPRKYISGAHAASLLTYKFSGFPGHKIFTSPLWALLGNSKIPYPPLDLQWRLYRRV